MTTVTAASGINNVYATPAALKRWLNKTDETDDLILWHLLNVASRAVDGICGRVFYTNRETRRFNVRHRFSVFVDDLIEAETVKEDCDGDGVFEVTVPASDYRLFPPDARPLTAAGRPHYALKRVVRRASGSFPIGIGSVEISGLWGYRTYTAALGLGLGNMGNVVMKGSLSIKVDDDRNVNSGETVFIDDEQLFVRSKGSNVLNVERGVNGTEAADHNDGTPLRLFLYPAEVVEATILMAVDRWRRRDGIGYLEGVAEGIQRELYNPGGDVAQLLKPYIRGKLL